VPEWLAKRQISAHCPCQSLPSCFSLYPNDWGYQILTDTKCRAAKPQEKSYKLSDAHGLYLFVAPTGLRSWRWKYRVAGREKVLTIGSYVCCSKQREVQE